MPHPVRVTLGALDNPAAPPRSVSPRGSSRRRSMLPYAPVPDGAGSGSPCARAARTHAAIASRALAAASS